LVANWDGTVDSFMGKDGSKIYLLRQLANKQLFEVISGIKRNSYNSYPTYKWRL
jgi:hypothetical protein